MQRLIASGIAVMIVYAVALIVGTVIAAPSSLSGWTQYLPAAQMYHDLFNGITGNWQHYGQLFTRLQSTLFWKMFLGIITVVPGIFLLHYLIVGAKAFSHDGPEVLFFGAFTRFIHWIGAVSFSMLVVTGLLIAMGSFFGGGLPIRLARTIHILSALVFAGDAVLMFLVWIKDMLPALYDLKWLFILGGYLSKEKKPVPAGKFNAGQKAWFWLATVGGGVMAYTGYVIWGFRADIETVRLYAIIHNLLGMALVALFLTHLYMSIFAIKGSLQSMISGYKPRDEVDILHSRYRYD